MHNHARQGPSPTLAPSRTARKPFMESVDDALALLPLSWRSVAKQATWNDSRTVDLRTFDRRFATRTASCAIHITTDGVVNAYLRDIEPETVFRAAIQVICFRVALVPSRCEALATLLEQAQSSGAALDPQGGDYSSWGSLASLESFAAELVTQTLTEPDADKAHPFLHPAAGTLWPGSHDLLLRAERELSALCLCFLAAQAGATANPGGTP